MTEPIDPELQKAVASLPSPSDVAEQTRRAQKIQEISNLVVTATSNMASELKVFQPAEGPFAFDLANLTWNGGVWLQHSTIPEVSVKPIFAAKIEGDNITLSASENDSEETLFSLPINDVTQAAVTDSVRKYFEPRLSAAVSAYSKQSASPA